MLYCIEIGGRISENYASFWVFLESNILLVLSGEVFCTET